MSLIVPYGYYSLREVLDTIGKEVFDEGWDSTTLDFNDNVKPAYVRDSYYESQSMIYPITESFLVSKVESFISYRYTEEEISSLSNEFLTQQEAYKEEERLKKKAINSNVTYRRGTLLPNNKAENLFLNSPTLIAQTKTKKIQMIQQGIRYATLTKGFKQLLYNGDLEGVILDTKSGKQQKIKKEFWLATSSEYSFAKSTGKYKDYYSYPMTFNGNTRYHTNSINYAGLIVFEKVQFNILQEKLFPKAKPKTLPKGRKPKIDWEKFQIEAFKRLRQATSNDLPKQDALASEMYDWCKNQFGEEVGLSTIKAKLKLIYDALKTS